MTALPPQPTVAPDRSDGDLTRPRLVAAVAWAAGVVALGVTLRLEPGNRTFVLGALVMASVWVVGAVLVGVGPWRGASSVGRQVLAGVGVGALAGVLCLVVGAAISRAEALAGPAQVLLAHRGTAPIAVVLAITIVNGIAEELFFRGALFGVTPARWAIPVTAVVYAAATIPSGIALLTAAGLMLGVMTAWLRQRTGGLLAPIAAHLTWSVGMLVLLPLVLTSGR